MDINFQEYQASLQKHEERIASDKVNMLSLEAFLFAKRISQHKTKNNKINKNLSSMLLEVVSEIQEFLENPHIELDEDDTDDINNLIPSIENLTLQAHHYFFCQCCNLSVKSSTKSLNEHFFSTKHLKNLRGAAAKLDLSTNSLRETKVKAMNENSNHSGSTHSLAETQNAQTKDKKKERLNSLPARVKEAMPKAKLPKKMREFLLKNNINSVANSFVEEGRFILLKNKHERIADHLQKKLSHRFPKVKIYPFGSYVAGLAHSKSDLDVFIDIDNNYYGKLQKRKMKEAIFLVKRILEASAKEGWSEFEPVGMSINIISFKNKI
jgi:predicted nucleotidyltransferase